MKQLIWTLGLGILMVASPAFGEKAKRRTASVERTRVSPSVTAGTKRKVRDLWVRVGISSGFSETNSNVASQQSARDQGGYNQNAYVGLNANAVFFQYGYLDLDAYYAGSPSAKAVTSLDRITGTTDNSVRRLRNYGGLGELGARLPRIRAGAYYRLSQPLTLGVQYIRRQLRNTISGETVPFTETTNQVLGTMVVHF